MIETYSIPASQHRTEIVVANSRFITSISPIFDVAGAKAFIASIRTEMPDASHHVYAFKVGYGNNVIEGMSDDGEPSGTSGPPTLAVVRGSLLGDIVLVTTRYFGGTKLGTGGLVRAYTDSAKMAIESCPVTLKIPKTRLMIEVPYSLFDKLRHFLTSYDLTIEDETFLESVIITLITPDHNVLSICNGIQELSAGSIEPIIIDEHIYL